MRRILAFLLLSIFTLLNVSLAYGVFKKDSTIRVALVEEDETHVEILEVKKYLNQDSHKPFDIFEINEYTSEHVFCDVEKKYEDVYLSAVETPPDFMC